MKIEVGKKYELNNGDVHECARVNGDDPNAVDKYGFGPFVINGVLYHQDGRVADCGLNHDLSVKREVITIEHGKYYRTRDGRKVGPMEEEQDGDFMAEHPDMGGRVTASWNPNGKRWMKEPNLDLIAEWGDETRDPELTRPYGDGNHPLPDVTPETGTLAELQVKPGDVVECVEYGGNYWTPGLKYTISKSGEIPSNDGELFHLEAPAYWKGRIISRASDKPKTWGEMSDAEKGELLLARHEGKVIENNASKGKWIAAYPVWADNVAYRIKPEPKRETVTLYGNGDNRGWGFDYCSGGATHRITFTTIDGEPDLDSIRMEVIK